MKQLALQLYRFAIVCVVAWLVRDLAVRQRTHGDSPIRVDEVTKFLPDAAALRPDSSERDGLFVLDRGRLISPAYSRLDRRNLDKLRDVRYTRARFEPVPTEGGAD